MISAASIARFMHAGHSSVGRLLHPAARLILLALGCFLPAALALHAGRERLAIAAAVVAVRGLLPAGAAFRDRIPSAPRPGRAPARSTAVKNHLRHPATSVRRRRDVHRARGRGAAGGGARCVAGPTGLPSEPVLHDDARALLARTRALPRAAAVAGSVAAALARAPGRTGRAFWALGRTRPASPGAWPMRGRPPKGCGSRRMAHRLGRRPHPCPLGPPHGHAGHERERRDRDSLELHRAPLRRDPQQPPHREAAVGPVRPIHRRMRCSRSRGGLVAPDALARAVVLHMGVTLPPRPDAGIRRALRAHRPLPGAAGARQGPRLPGRGGRAAPRPRRPVRAVAGGRRPRATRTFGGGSSELGLGDRVRLLGTVPHAELLRLYRERRVDCVVLPSLDLGGGLHEGLSVALVEAMAHGIPVIGDTDGRYSRAARALGRRARARRPTPSDLADALADVLGSPSLRCRLGAAGRTRVEQEFDARVIARTLARWFGDRRYAGAGGVAHAQRAARRPEFRADERRLGRARTEAGEVSARASAGAPPCSPVSAERWACRRTRDCWRRCPRSK